MWGSGSSLISLNRNKFNPIADRTVTKIRAGITAGDINGVGIELILKAFSEQSLLDLCTPIVYADIDVMNYHMDALHISNVPLNMISEEAGAKGGVLNVFPRWNDPVSFDLGKNRPSGGKYALESLQRASKAIEEGSIDLMITAPLNKNNIEHIGFNGHTGFLAERFGKEAIMIMVSEEMKVALVTGHIPISEVSQSLTADLVLGKIKALYQSLISDFGIEDPSIAVLGLNPHAGDEGLIGKEDIEIIAPAVSQASEQEINASGPISADGFFGSKSYRQYDGVLAMYHDQGLIPFKSISFDTGVNFTAGLSIVRTSPGHGVAFDLAGQGIASTTSFEESVRLACDIYKRRLNQTEERYFIGDEEA